MDCRICKAPISPFMSFGQQPIANGFLTADQIKDEYFYELAPAVCGQCGMFQLMEQPDPERMFHQSYPFFSGSSEHMKAHFAAWANSVALPPDPFVVEIGCNDGTLLQHFKQHRHLGVEPSTNVADVAIGKGLKVLCGFFNEDLAWRLTNAYGQADLILAANVLCHIPDLNSVARGVAQLLKPDGRFVFEEPYLGDVIAKTAYDQIYDEHVFLFSLTSISNAFARHGLGIIDYVPQPTHGGSMRYTIGRTGRPVYDAAFDLQAFAGRCQRSRDKFTAVVRALKGNAVAGYGATSKSTTVLNYCGLGPEDIAWICDTTPIKQGKLSPGMHIPIVPHEHFKTHPPDYAILFAWNHAKEILAKEDFTGIWISVS